MIKKMIVKNNDFNISQIADSGQCFRIFESSKGVWEVIAFGKTLKIRSVECDTNKNNKSKTDSYFFECNEKEYNEIWYDYFDLQRNYGDIKNKIQETKDNYLIEAVNFGYGIRILNQDLWEVIISFIISQRNSIKRIRKNIEKLCVTVHPTNKNLFPSPDELVKLSESDLIKIGLGYRAKYVHAVAVNTVEGKLDLEKLRNMSYAESIEYLKKFDGIGDKVANCIALFGLHKLEAFPVDVWIKRILDKRYGGNFDIERFKGYAGIVQQYMFYYERNTGKEKIENLYNFNESMI